MLTLVSGKTSNLPSKYHVRIQRKMFPSSIIPFINVDQDY